MKRKRAYAATSVAGVLLAGAIALVSIQLHDWPTNHFAVVQPNVLYRGGQPRSAGWAHITDRYGIKTVVNLRGPFPDQDWWQEEQKHCRQNNIAVFDVPIGKDGNAASGLRQFLSIVTDPNNQPVFVHCEAGSARTGYAVAAYRIAIQGWSCDRAVNEAVTFRFNTKVPQNREYGRILRELAGGLSWRKLPDATVAASASTGDKNE